MADRSNSVGLIIIYKNRSALKIGVEVTTNVKFTSALLTLPTIYETNTLRKISSIVSDQTSLITQIVSVRPESGFQCLSFAITESSISPDALDTLFMNYDSSKRYIPDDRFIYQGLFDKSCVFLNAMSMNIDIFIKFDSVSSYELLRSISHKEFVIITKKDCNKFHSIQFCSLNSSTCDEYISGSGSHKPHQYPSISHLCILHSNNNTDSGRSVSMYRFFGLDTTTTPTQAPTSSPVAQDKTEGYLGFFSLIYYGIGVLALITLIFYIAFRDSPICKRQGRRRRRRERTDTESISEKWSKRSDPDDDEDIDLSSHSLRAQAAEEPSTSPNRSTNILHGYSGVVEAVSGDATAGNELVTTAQDIVTRPPQPAVTTAPLPFTSPTRVAPDLNSSQAPPAAGFMFDLLPTSPANNTSAAITQETSSINSYSPLTTSTATYFRSNRVQTESAR